MSLAPSCRVLVLLASLAALTACSSLQPLATEDEAAETAAPAASANPAVVALLDSAQTDAAAGRLATATASIERALRIEPRNPALWQELALLKLQQGAYAQAENFAARSNSWAGADKALQARNWRIIGEARGRRGDNAGARAALERARALEQD